MTFVSPESLMMPEEIVRDLKSNGCDVAETSDLLSVLGSSDVVYMTRIQRERFPTRQSTRR